MPVVPRYEPQVQSTSLPAPRFSTEAPVEAFGGGQERAFEAAAGIANTVNKIVLEEKRKADQVAFMAADKSASELETRLQVEVGKRRGKDAFGAPDFVSQEWKKGLEEIQKNLANDDQRVAFERAASNRWESLNKHVNVYVAGQQREFDENETKGYLSTARNAAALNAHDDERISLELARQRGALTDWARRNGVPIDSEQFKNDLVKETSATHRAVIAARLDADQDIKAKEYFDSVKSEMTPEDRDRIANAIEEGSLRGESQRQSDKILMEKKNWTDRMSAAREISDPKVRDAVESRLKNELSTEKSLEAEERNDLYLQATNLLEKRLGEEPRRVIPPSIWTKLSLEQRKSLEAYADNPVNDDKAWLEFLDLNAGQLSGLSLSDFQSKFWSRFDKSHRTRAEQMWDSAKTSSEKDPKLTSTLSFKDRVDNALRVSGQVPADKEKSKFSKNEAELYAQFEGLAAREVENFEATQLGGKRKATGEEIQKIVDGLLVRKVFVDKAWARDPEKLAILLTDEEKGASYVPFGKVPDAERNAIENLFRSRQKKASRNQIERAYGAVLLKDKKRLEQILAE